MPYPAGHRNEVRKKIVQSARRLFNRHGFDSVSLKEIMAGAGLAHGGFYSYFESKSDLYVDARRRPSSDRWSNELDRADSQRLTIC